MPCSAISWAIELSTILGLLGAAGLFGYQQYLIRDRDRQRCFGAFANNVWVGFAFFAGVVAELTMAAAADEPDPLIAWIGKLIDKAGRAVGWLTLVMALRPWPS